MSLKIEHLNAEEMRGTLDGMLPVSGRVENGMIRISIATWKQEIPRDVVSGEAAMRHAVYHALARYREAFRPAPMRFAAE